MSSEQSKAYHSITIGEKNTWDDWHLVPSSRPLFNAPTVKTSIIDLPGGDGAIDLTEVLAGRPTYNRRTGSWDFYVMNGYVDWQDLYSEIMVYLQGKEFRAILDDDPGYYYIGRFSVNQWRSEPNWSRIVIDYNVDPYKRDVDGYGDNWLWDPFNFETGYIKSFKNLVVSGTLTLTYLNDMLSSTPTFITNKANMKLIFNGVTYNLSKGANTFNDVRFVQGENTVTFTGNGTVTIESVGGRL